MSHLDSCIRPGGGHFVFSSTLTDGQYANESESDWRQQNTKGYSRKHHSVVVYAVTMADNRVVAEIVNDFFLNACLLRRPLNEDTIGVLRQLLHKYSA